MKPRRYFIAHTPTRTEILEILSERGYQDYSWPWEKDDPDRVRYFKRPDGRLTRLSPDGMLELCSE